MTQNIHTTLPLANGTAIPQLGLGVWRSEPGMETAQAVQWALEAGYRHIDTAAIYQNEADVGQGIRNSGVAREEIFVTTKVWNTDQGYDAASQALDTSLGKLGLDHVDLYLIHWPVEGKFQDTWRALETLYEEGKAEAIGVSNFHIHHLEDLMGSAKIMPMVNQVEFHPRLQQPELLAFDQKHGIVHEAWAPIMKGKVNEVAEIRAIAQKHGKTPVQVTLRWELQKGVVTIPKSVHQERITANADLYGFELDSKDMAAMDALDQGARIGPDPDNFSF